MRQQTISGPFEARCIGPGTWLLVDTPGSGAQIHLRGVDTEAGFALRHTVFDSLSFEWRGGEVRIAAAGPTGASRLIVASAVIHQARTDLYGHLPLAGFDAPAQRFWNRVFRLMRWPGGRYLLRFIAGRKRAKGA